MLVRPLQIVVITLFSSTILTLAALMYWKEVMIKLMCTTSTCKAASEPRYLWQYACYNAWSIDIRYTDEAEEHKPIAISTLHQTWRVPQKVGACHWLVQLMKQSVIARVYLLAVGRGRRLCSLAVVWLAQSRQLIARHEKQGCKYPWWGSYKVQTLLPCQAKLFHNVEKQSNTSPVKSSELDVRLGQEVVFNSTKWSKSPV